MTTLPGERPIPILDQAALLWGAVGALEKRGAVFERAEIGGHNKPVIHLLYNAAARDLKGAESHLTRSNGKGDVVVMVTDYRGCQVQWTEPRSART